MMKIVIISGTPCTGKTSLSLLFGEEMGASLIPLGEFVKEKKIFDSWDDADQSYVIDEERARDALLSHIERLQENESITMLVIEGLFSDVIADHADLRIVLRVHPTVLEKRLKARGYPEKKIFDNLQSEVLGTCSKHMKDEVGNEFLDIDTTSMSPREVFDAIRKVLDSTLDASKFKPGLVDWIMDENLDLERFFTKKE
ncbi:MAG: adenylate kinase family protein [Promethearchaeota archaeon]